MLVASGKTIAEKGVTASRSNPSLFCFALIGTPIHWSKSVLFHSDLGTTRLPKNLKIENKSSTEFWILLDNNDRVGAAGLVECAKKPSRSTSERPSESSLDLGASFSLLRRVVLNCVSLVEYH